VSPQCCDVLVAGAGPAGSAAAALFARAGYDVRLLDRAVFPRFKPCGDFLSPECNRILERLGLEEAVGRAGARRLRGLLVSTHGEPPLRADFDPGECAFGYCLERARLDVLLVEAARAAGATVLEGWSVEGLGQSVVRVKTPEGVSSACRARLVIGAGGKRCPIARDLGVQRRPSGDGRIDFLCHWEAADVERAYCEMHVAGPGYTGLAAAGPDILNVNTVVPRSWLRRWSQGRDGIGGDSGPQASRGGTLRTGIYRGLLEGSPAILRALAGGRPRYAPVASDVSPLSTTRASADGVLLVGDAALFIDPFTGQGIYLALRSAELAFEVGSVALAAGDIRAERLADYDRMRDREFAPKVLLSRILQVILYRPWLARRVAGALRRDRRGAGRLIGVIGDYRPAADLLRLDFLIRLASAGIG